MRDLLCFFFFFHSLPLPAWLFCQAASHCSEAQCHAEQEQPDSLPVEDPVRNAERPSVASNY